MRTMLSSSVVIGPDLNTLTPRNFFAFEHANSKTV
jgi:hypothetical protein